MGEGRAGMMPLYWDTLYWDALGRNVPGWDAVDL